MNVFRWINWLRQRSSETLVLLLFLALFPYTIVATFWEPIEVLAQAHTISPLELFEAESGKTRVVTEDIAHAVNWLAKYEVESFYLSSEFQGNAYYRQRLLGLSYPKRTRSEAKYIFFLKVEPLPENCHLLEEYGEIRFVQC